MKKLVLLLLLIIPIISLADDVDDYFSSQEIKLNLYQKLNQYYQKQLENNFSQSIKSTANKFNLSPQDVQDILDGNMAKCIKLFENKKIKCQKTNGIYPPSCFEDCFNKIQDAISGFNLQNAINSANEQSTKQLGIFADGTTEDSPYDLLVDFNQIQDILFKQHPKSPKIRINVKYKNVLKQGAGILNNKIENILEKPTDFYKYLRQNINNGINSATNEINNLIQQANNLTNNGNNQQNNNQQNGNSNNSNNPNNPSKEIKNQNIVIGNICSQTNNSNGNQNNSAQINNITNNQNPTNSSQIKTENSKFPTFGDFNGQYSDNPNGLDNFFSNLGNNIGNLIGNQGNQDNKQSDFDKLLNGICDGDKKGILKICLQLIPSGPRPGSIGGTKKVKSIQEVIFEINQVLKDIKSSFIIPAGHGDESMDIDYEHLQWSKIISFDIVYSSKPVFKFNKDKKVEKDINTKDLPACENVPRILGDLYEKAGIAYCSAKVVDEKKYLLDKKEVVSLTLNNIKGDKVPQSANQEVFLEKMVNILKSSFSNLDETLQAVRGETAIMKIKSE